MKSELFKEGYIRISIHETELANCGSSDPTEICRASILGPDRKFLVTRNVSITVENLRNMGQYYYLWHVFIENIFINLEGI